MRAVPRKEPVLVVDDDDDIASVVARFVGGLGHEVRVAGNGRRALEELNGVGLVITDINMPDMDGIELIMALRTSDPDLPVIAMSGGGMIDKEVLLDTAGALGALVTLAKPFGIGELREAIDTALTGEGGRGDA